MPRTLTAEEIEDFRDRLTDAATRLFAEKGRDAVSMRELAGELGVSPMTPYRYFKDKDEILAAVCIRAFDRFSDALETARANATGSAMERSSAVGNAYIAFAFANPHAYRLMFDMAWGQEHKYPDVKRATDRARKTMTAHLTPLIKQGVLIGDPQLIGHAYWALLHGAIELKLAGKLTAEQDFDAIITDALTALTRGYSPKD